MKSQAFASKFNRVDLKFYDYNESIYSFSSPEIKEDPLTEISERMLSLNRRGFNVYSAQAIIHSRFEIKSSQYTTLRKPWFDIYYKSNKQEGLIYLDSKELDGTYTTNTEHEIYFDYQTRSADIIYDAFLNAGSRFFVKLRDFTIYETGKKYSDILKGVEAKSVPITTSFMENEGLAPSRVETTYVGINGKTGFIDHILKTAFKDTGKNEILKWFVGAEFIKNSIFDHQFRPNEGIGLAYFSNKRSDNTPLYLTRGILKNDPVTKSGKLPITTSSVKIKIIPIDVQIPEESKNPIILPNCGRGLWDTNQVHYIQTTLGWSNKTTNFADHFLRDGFIKIHTIKGVLLEGNLSALVKRKFLKLTTLKSGALTLEFLDNIKNKIIGLNLQISVDLSVAPAIIKIQDGALVEINRTCTRGHSDPPRGADGGRGGGGNKSTSYHESGYGFEEKELRAKYDLNVHFLSY